MSKFAFVCPYFWPEAIGSAPYCTELAEWLAARGHRVEIITRRPHYPSAAEFDAWADGSRDEELHNGMFISRVPALDFASGKLWRRAYNDFRFLVGVIGRAFTRYSDEVAIVVFVPSCLALIGAKLLALKSGARLICVVHDVESGLAGSLGIASMRLFVSGVRLIEKLAFNLPDQLIVLSEGMYDELRRLGCRRPVMIIPIWASVVSDDEVEPDSTPTIAYSGNFGKKQNLDQLLPLIGLLNKRLPEVRVHLRGEGAERPRIEAQVASMRVSNTTFLPLVPKEELLSSIQSAILQLVPQATGSGNYAFPSKLISIMSAGRPYVCIAERDTIIDRITRNSGGGVCVPPNDDEALYNAVVEIIRDSKRGRELGLCGRRYVQKTMDRLSILSQYEEIIKCQAPTSAELLPIR
jgi:colanic acid biosynthesis glycosyl transferase WcaI